MVKRLNAPRAGQYNASAIERLVRDSTGDILPIDATDADQIENLADIATSGSATDLVAGTVPAARMPAHTGDVTSSAGAVALTIPNDTVTYAKMQNVSAASKLLGRGSASGSGDVEEITLGTGLTMSGTTLSATEYTDPWTYDKLTLEFTTTSTTDVTTGLSFAGSTFLANTNYEFEVLLQVRRSGAASALNVSMVWPGGVEGVVAGIYGTVPNLAQGNESATLVLSVNAGNFVPVWLRGTFHVLASNATGTFDIQIAAPAANTARVNWGSFIKYRRLG